MDPDGRTRRVAVAHRDPARPEALRTASAFYVGVLPSVHPFRAAYGHCAPLLLAEVGDAWHDAVALTSATSATVTRESARSRSSVLRSAAWRSAFGDGHSPPKAARASAR